MYTALLSLSAVSTLSDVDTTYLVDKFRQACMNGQARFAKGEIKEVSHNALASDVRSYYSGLNGTKFDGVKFYEIALPSPAYLITWQRKPGGEYYTQACAIVARDLPYIKTWEQVLRIEFSSRNRSRLIETEARRYRNEFPIPEEGKKITIDRVYGGRFVALQVSAMSEIEIRDWRSSAAIRRSPLSESPK